MDCNRYASSDQGSVNVLGARYDADRDWENCILEHRHVHHVYPVTYLCNDKTEHNRFDDYKHLPKHKHLLSHNDQHHNLGDHSHQRRSRPSRRHIEWCCCGYGSRIFHRSLRRHYRLHLCCKMVPEAAQPECRRPPYINRKATSRSGAYHTGSRRTRCTFLNLVRREAEIARIPCAFSNLYHERHKSYYY